MTEAAFAESAEYALHYFAKDIKYQCRYYNISHILLYLVLQSSNKEPDVSLELTNLQFEFGLSQT